MRHTPADDHVVIAGQVHGDLGRAEVILLAQVDDVAHHFGVGLMRARSGPARAIPQTFLAEVLVLAQPLVEGRPADPVVAARGRHTPRHLLSVAKNRQAMPDLALLLSFVHGGVSLMRDPDVQTVGHRGYVLSSILAAPLAER